MTNLLEETKEAIKRSGHEPADIMFIGAIASLSDSGYSCTWEEYEQLANIQYDSGYGGQEVARDLKIYFTDGSSMWRGEYDGSEWWEYGVPFVMPQNPNPIKFIVSDSSWSTLEEMNRPGGKYGDGDV